MIKKLLAVFCLCASAWATTSVTGNVKNLGTGSVSAGTFVRFYLRGCSGNQPRINGTGIIAPTLGNVFYFDFVPNSSGAISGTLYSTRDAAGTGNGEIECGGSFTSVWYGMVVFQNGKAGPETPIHAKNTATIDISNITPITTNPVVTAPTGDSTYARLDGGNQNFTGAIGAPAVTAGNVTAAGPNPWIDPTHPTFGAKCDGITDDSTALQAAINAAISNNAWLYIPTGKTCAHASTLNMNGGASSVRMFGTPFASSLKYTGSGSGWLWKNGNGSPFIFNPTVLGVNFLCGNAAGCSKGIEAWSISESVLRDVRIGQFSGPFATDLWCSGCNIGDWDHIVLSAQTAQPSSGALGIDCINCAALWIRNGDFFYFPTATMRFSGTGTVSDIIDGNWFEAQDVAVLVDDSVNITATDALSMVNNRFLFDGAGGVAPTGGTFPNQVALKINNTGTNSLAMQGTNFLNNTYFCATSLCSAANPVVVSVSGSTGAGTAIDLTIKDNLLRGASQGIVSSNSTRVSGLIENNRSFNQSATTLTTDVTGANGFAAKKIRSDGTMAIGRNNAQTTETLDVQDATASTGVTTFSLRAGAGQGSTAAFRYFDPSGNNTIIITAQGTLAINGQAPQFLFTNGTSRMSFNITGTESGSNTGSDLILSRYSDAGSFLDSPITVKRSTGLVTFADGIVGGGSAAGLTGTGACATFSNQAGGSWAGSAKCTGTTAASTLTITPGTTAANGWVCNVQDETTRANLFQQTSHTQTTCVLTATSVTQNDIFVFSAIAF